MNQKISQRRHQHSANRDWHQWYHLMKKARMLATAADEECRSDTRDCLRKQGEALRILARQMGEATGIYESIRKAADDGYASPQLLELAQAERGL